MDKNDERTLIELVQRMNKRQTDLEKHEGE